MMTFGRTVSLALLLILARTPSAMAQCAAPTWTQQNVPGPSARDQLSMAYDRDRGVIVLFGGKTGESIFGETWEWDGVSWIRRFPAHSPSARSGCALVYDRDRHATILFGGENASGGYPNDTWRWDGTDWTQLSATNSPPGRRHPGVAFDEERGLVVLFAGANASTDFADTWTWDGSTWTPHPEATGPAVRRNLGMCYDTTRQRIVAFGGWNGTAYRADTWEGAWVGNTFSWSRVAVNGGPTGRAGTRMVYDAACQTCLLFGGNNDQFTFGDTWEWDGSGWAQRAQSGPSASVNVGLAYDLARAETIVFGGSNNGVYSNQTWRARRSTPCPGDVNGDGGVDLADLAILLASFGTSCP